MTTATARIVVYDKDSNIIMHVLIAHKKDLGVYRQKKEWK